MTLKNMIELADGLTPIETEIGYYILKNQEDILDMSVIELAEICVKISHSSILQKDWVKRIQ